MGVMNDHDPVETQEWIDSLRSVVQYQGVERARFLLTKLRDESVRTGSRPAFTLTTPYINTILPPAISSALRPWSCTGYDFPSK